MDTEACGLVDSPKDHALQPTHQSVKIGYLLNEMANKPANIPPNLLPWIEVRKRFRLSHTQIQMARELGMNPKKFGGLANHRQEP